MRRARLRRLAGAGGTNVLTAAALTPGCGRYAEDTTDWTVRPALTARADVVPVALDAEPAATTQPAMDPVRTTTPAITVPKGPSQRDQFPAATRPRPVLLSRKDRWSTTRIWLRRQGLV